MLNQNGSDTMIMFDESTTAKLCESYLIYNQINYKDMEIVINENNNKWKDTHGNKTNI